MLGTKSNTESSTSRKFFKSRMVKMFWLVWNSSKICAPELAPITPRQLQVSYNSGIFKTAGQLPEYNPLLIYIIPFIFLNSGHLGKIAFICCFHRLYSEELNLIILPLETSCGQFFFNFNSRAHILDRYFCTIFVTPTRLHLVQTYFKF